MSKKFRLDRMIGFQNTFKTKCINVIIDSIGPSIILRSIYIWYIAYSLFQVLTNVDLRYQHHLNTSMAENQQVSAFPLPPKQYVDLYTDENVKRNRVPAPPPIIQVCTQVKINNKFQHEILTIFLPIIIAYVLGAQKNRLIETVLLSTHKICFG